MKLALTFTLIYAKISELIFVVAGKWLAMKFQVYSNSKIYSRNKPHTHGLNDKHGLVNGLL